MLDRVIEADVPPQVSMSLSASLAELREPGKVASSFSQQVCGKGGLSVAAYPPVCAPSLSYSCECCQGWEDGRNRVSGLPRGDSDGL